MIIDMDLVICLILKLLIEGCVLRERWKLWRIRDSIHIMLVDIGAVVILRRSILVADCLVNLVGVRFGHQLHVLKSSWIVVRARCKPGIIEIGIHSRGIRLI